ncbi:phage minor tail protein L [Cardiobacteriaceae bacterium TAE3-ERU3]|nr:phage minor tail protein L [Cardiobacteriaceae bacterium TAE3-ERU3]
MRNVQHPETLADLSQDALITLFDIDLTKVNGGITYFCDKLNERNEPMIWKEQVYTPYPIIARGFEVRGDGPSGRPTLTVSNLLGWVTGAVAAYDGIVGCKVTRRQVQARYLDPMNFITESNPDHDPLAEFVDRWTINRLTSLNKNSATFELASPSETDNAVLPARPVLANVRPSLQELKQKYGKTAVLPYRGFPSVNKRGS